MNADKDFRLERHITQRVIDAFYHVYNELGRGFVESGYENATCLALTQIGASVRQRYPLTVAFRGSIVGEFRADLFVEDNIVVEPKAVSRVTTTHEVRLVNYLRATRCLVGLLLNFGRSARFKRRVLSQHVDNPRKSAPIRVQEDV